MKRFDINQVLEMIPAQSQLIDEYRKSSITGNAWWVGAEYVKEYFFNQLNTIIMSKKQETIITVVKALGLSGMQAEPRSILLVAKMLDKVEEVGEDISLKNISDIQDEVDNEWPVQNPPTESRPGNSE